jgi:hypothetical protein
MTCPTCNQRTCHENMMECWLCFYGLAEYATDWALEEWENENS